jgi:hypothetical protein
MMAEKEVTQGYITEQNNIITNSENLLKECGWSLVEIDDLHKICTF